MRISKILVLALAIALSSLFISNAVAQAATAPASAPAANTPAPTSTAKVGIVSIQDAIFATNEGKKEADALNQRFAPKQAELKNLNDEVENLKKQLQTQGDKLSDEEKNTRVRTIEVKQKSLQRNMEDAQNDYQQASQEVLNRIGTKMMTVLENYAKAKGYSMILDVSNPQTPVLWASPGSNITKELVDAYNAANPAAAPAANKPAAAARPPAARPAAPTPKKP